MVEVTTNTASVSTLTEEFFANFDVVCVTRQPAEESFRINSYCRKQGIPFYSGDVFGFGGFFFVDLLEHEYAEYNLTIFHPLLDNF